MESVPKPDGIPAVREWAEIQKLHDTICMVLEEEVDLGLPMSTLRPLSIVRDALCWVLNHEHEQFNNAMLDLQARVYGKGFDWVPQPEYED